MYVEERGRQHLIFFCLLICLMRRLTVYGHRMSLLYIEHSCWLRTAELDHILIKNLRKIWEVYFAVGASFICLRIQISSSNSIQVIFFLQRV